MLDPETWLSEYGDELYRFARFRVSSDEIAEDLLQETLVSALKSRENFSQQSSEKTWLIGIMKHKIADHFRKAYKDKALLKVDDEEGWNELFDEQGMWKSMPSKHWQQDPHTLLENAEFRQAFRQCVENLPEKLQKTYQMKEIEEIDTKEMCNLLSTTSTNIWVTIHRARTRLKSCLEKMWFKEGVG